MVRIEVAKEALAAVRADADVIAIVLESDTPIAAAALNEVTASNAAAAPLAPIAPTPADTAAGGMMSRLFNRHLPALARSGCLHAPDDETPGRVQYSFPPAARVG